tara:strand:+ start:902 stop:1276 length:375 start_codon:yes stop_codon:yes gene_type:complete
MNQLNMFQTYDSKLSKSERDKGLARTQSVNQNWLDLALIHLSRWNGKSEITGEDIRIEISQFVGEPQSANAWGALTRSAVIKGLLQDTGKVSLAKSVTSHARRLPIWKFIPKPCTASEYAKARG